MSGCRRTWSESQAAYLGDYTPIKRNYLIGDLLEDFEGHDVVKAVHVQADWGGNQVDETRWLQSIADEHGLPHGIVARTDLRRPDALAELEDHLRSPNMRGIRMLAYQPGLYEDPAFRRGFAHLGRLGLTFDLGTLWQQIGEGYQLVKSFPDTMFVLGHAGMPFGRDPELLGAWRKAIRMLATAPNVFVKVSGLGMGDHHWTVDSLRPIVMATIETFGPERSMLATNWPVDRLYSTYGVLLSAYEEITSVYTPDESPRPVAGKRGALLPNLKACERDEGTGMSQRQDQKVQDRRLEGSGRMRARVIGVVSPNWVHTAMDVKFNERYFMDPEYRQVENRQVAAWLGTFNTMLQTRFARFDVDWEPVGISGVAGMYDPDGLEKLTVGLPQPFPVVTAMFGGEIVYFDNDNPDSKGEPLAGIGSASEVHIPDFATTFPVSVYVQQYEALAARFGKDKVDLSFLYLHSPLTIAYRLRGEQLFLDMVDDPELATAILEAAHATSLGVYEMYERIGGRPERVLPIATCIASLISPDVYRRWEIPMAAAPDRAASPGARPLLRAIQPCPRPAGRTPGHHLHGGGRGNRYRANPGAVPGSNHQLRGRHAEVPEPHGFAGRRGDPPGHP